MKKLRKHWKWEMFLMLLIAGFLGAVAMPNHFAKSTVTAPKNACIANLKQIDGAIQQWAMENKKKETEAPDLQAAVKYLKNGELPKCKEGGVYSAGKTIADPPTCSLGSTQGHTLP